MVAAAQVSFILLEQSFVRLQLAARVACAAAFGVLPLLLFAPHPTWARLLLVLSFGGYAAYKLLFLRLMDRTIRQLRLEAHFLRHAGEPFRLPFYVWQDDHLWRHSLVLQGLRAARARPLPRFLHPGEKQQRLTKFFRNAFDEMLPGRLNPDLLAWLLFLLLLVASPLLTRPVSLWLLLPALASALLTLTAELFQTITLWQVRRSFDTLADALSEWTQAQEDLVFQNPAKRYTHTLLYTAPSWFKKPPPGARAPHAQKNGRSRDTVKAYAHTLLYFAPAWLDQARHLPLPKMA